MQGLSFFVAVAAMVLAVGACNSNTDATVSSPSPVTTTETYTGTISQLGQAIHPFAVSTTGTTTVSLTSVEPLTTMAVGVSIGSWSGTACGTAIASNDNARSGTTALTGTASAGNYCVRVYDSGNVPESWSVTYSVQVIHP